MQSKEASELNNRVICSETLDQKFPSLQDSACFVKIGTQFFTKKKEPCELGNPSRRPRKRRSKSVLSQRLWTILLRPPIIRIFPGLLLAVVRTLRAKRILFQNKMKAIHYSSWSCTIDTVKTTTLILLRVDKLQLWKNPRSNHCILFREMGTPIFV